LPSSLKPEEEKHCRACRKAFVSILQNAMSEDGAIYHSAKIRKILELLGYIKRHEGGVQKTIIFSQFVKMIDLISSVLKEMGISHVRCEAQSAYCIAD
jgi:SNF2 family DNA or RNA helicase